MAILKTIDISRNPQIIQWKIDINTKKNWQNSKVRKKNQPSLRNWYLNIQKSKDIKYFRNIITTIDSSPIEYTLISSMQDYL